MHIELDYGRQGLTVELPDDHVVHTLSHHSVDPLTDPGTAVRQVLEAPTGTPSLQELARHRQSACILICDITRPVPNAIILPLLLA